MQITIFNDNLPGHKKHCFFINGFHEKRMIFGNKRMGNAKGGTIGGQNLIANSMA